MRRVAAALLGLTFALFTGQAPALHVHLYADHDHPEHRHGPAAHEHDVARAHPEGDSPGWSACDPGQHTIPGALGWTPVSHRETISAALPQSILTDAAVRAAPVRRITDLRVHGPPARWQLPPRAPPSTLLA